MLTGTEFVGSSALTGCRGYPEPVPGGGSGNLLLSPVFKDTELLAERFTELVFREQNNLAINTPLMGVFQTLVAQTPGRFRVTYPCRCPCSTGSSCCWGWRERPRHPRPPAGTATGHPDVRISTAITTVVT